MSGPHRDRVNARLEAVLRPFAEEAIPSADVDLLALIRKVVTDAGLVRVERLSGPIPPNLHGVVQESSVAVSHPAFSATASLATLLDQIIAGLFALRAEHLVAGVEGDLITYDGSGNGERLPVGADGEVLTVVSGDPAWAAPTGMTNPMTAEDDLIVGGVSGAPARLAKGADGQVLTVDAGTHHLAWASPTGGGIELAEGGSSVVATLAVIDFDASDFTTADAGSGRGTVALNYGAGAGQPAEGNDSRFHSPVTVVDGTGIDFTLTGQQITAEPIFAGTGAAGTVAHSDHTHASILPIAESDVTGLVGDLATLTTSVAAKMTSPMTTQDDLIVGGASGAPGRLGKGADGQVLTVDPTTHHLVWATPSSGFSDPTTTKGDLIVHDASSTTRLGVGSDGQVLTADATQTAGVKWATPSVSAAYLSSSPRPPAWYAANPGNNNAAAVGAIPSWNCTVVAANDNDANGPWVKFSTSATSGSVGASGSSAFWGARRNWSSILTVRDRLVDVANVRIWVGLFASNPSGSATPLVHLAAFRFDTGAGDTHWMACTGDASSVTATDTGITPASGDRPTLEIQLGASNVVFLINGVVVATNTTHLPSGSSDLGYQTWLTTLANAAKSIAEGSAVFYPMGR